MKIIQHVAHWNFRQLATYASIVLAGDKGIPNTIEDFGECLLVVTDIGEALVFTAQ